MLGVHVLVNCHAGLGRLRGQVDLYLGKVVFGRRLLSFRWLGHCHPPLLLPSHERVRALQRLATVRARLLRLGLRLLAFLLRRELLNLSL